jgi:hypothetical protein
MKEEFKPFDAAEYLETPEDMAWLSGRLPGGRQRRRRLNTQGLGQYRAGVWHVSDRT